MKIKSIVRLFDKIDLNAIVKSRISKSPLIINQTIKFDGSFSK